MPRPQLSDPIKFCMSCGKQILRKRYGKNLEDRTAFRKRKFCNLQCAGAHHQKDHPTLSALRKRAEKLVGKSCENCGTTKRLNVHHVDLNPANNEQSNIMTLCVVCHASWHWKYGRHRELNVMKPSPCSVCNEEFSRLKMGMCQKHYQRFKKYGDPLMTKRWTGSSFELVRETHSVRSVQTSKESPKACQTAPTG